MANFKVENLLTLQEASEYMLETYVATHRSTIHRWCRDGVDGLFLEHMIVGGKYATSAESVDRFLTTIDNRGEVVCQKKV